jgi:hypothetical protein
MNVNARIYMMSIGASKCHTTQGIDKENFDIWREMKYYNCIKTDIINNKVSPNFVAPILFKIDPTSRIDWDKLGNIKDDSTLKYKLEKVISNNNLVNNLHNEDNRNSYLARLVPFIKNISSSDGQKLQNMLNSKQSSTTQPKLDITINSGKSLILLTEAPTTSLLQWASIIYQQFGTINKMVSSGYHLPEIWKSIIFQMLYIFAVLQEKEILMENINIENNFYIKDIFSDTNSVGSWIYKIDDIEFFIPNYGYILQFDSFYNDYNDEPTTSVQRFKIYGKIFKNNSDKQNINFREAIYNQFKKIINPDTFDVTGQHNGMSRPDNSVLDLLGKIYNDTTTNNIKELILKYFHPYVNNRVGTLLMKSEKDNINVLSKPIFQKGKMMVYQKRYQEFEWVIYVDDVMGDSYKKIIICNNNTNNNLHITQVFSNSLYNYPELEAIQPISKANMKYDESHIYERYNLSNLVL